MNELFYKTLRMIHVGVIILDEKHNIVFFNSAIEKLCNIPEKKVIGKKIEDILPVFAGEQYIKMIDTVLSTGQSRFCSSALHKSFVFPQGESRDSRRQNMRLEFVESEKKNYIILQIIDISENFKNEVKLINNIAQLKKGYDDLNFTKEATEKLAKYDVLTGLLNRFYFEMKFNELAEEAIRNSEKFAILFIDIDGFKQVNDTYGHMIGDVLLQMIAARLKNNTKSSDFVMRMGGDEFIIAQKNVVFNEYALKLAEKLLDILRKPYYIDGKAISVSASIGISIFPDHSQVLGELIDRADKAMYLSKKSGKNTVRLFGSSWLDNI